VPPAPEVLLFDVGGQRFAVPLGAVREVFNLGPLTPVPTAPGAVAGVTNLRGQVVPVLDLALLLEVGLHRLRLGDPAVLVEADGVRAALLVERVVGIRRRPGAGAAPLPEQPATLLEVAPLLGRITAQLARGAAGSGSAPC
jgi:purine-binding chemotaxis protein CheW